MNSEHDRKQKEAMNPGANLNLNPGSATLGSMNLGKRCNLSTSPFLYLANAATNNSTYCLICWKNQKLTYLKHLGQCLEDSKCHIKASRNSTLGLHSAL